MTTVDSRVNTAVQEMIDRFVTESQQIGMQVCAYKDGEVAVDAVAGQMGPEDTRPVQRDSLFLSFSATKGVASTVVHMLVDRGQLDYDAPVAQYWPEFGQHGKDRVTVAQA